MKKIRIVLIVLIILVTGITSIILLNEYRASQEEYRQLIGEENKDISLIFDLELRKKNNSFVWVKGKNTDIIIEEFNKKGCSLTFRDIEKTKVFYKDVIGNDEAIESRKKLFKTIKKYKKVEKLDNRPDVVLHDFFVGYLDWQFK